MPEVDVNIGGRYFQVVCQSGEERFLQAAVALLDHEARSVVEKTGRLPETQVLLMAGLILADKMAALKDELAGLKSRNRQLEERAAQAVQPSETAMVPPQLVAGMAKIASQAEALAARLERLQD